MGEKPLSFACSCSRERVAAMLQSLGEDEARAAAETPAPSRCVANSAGVSITFH
jgi:redox-regulated HSP33 family molecular chaperone